MTSPTYPGRQAFSGKTYDHEFDYERLTSLQGRVASVLARGGWWTTEEIMAITGGSYGGVQARARDMRKEKCGKQDVPARRRGNESNGLWEYCWNREGADAA